MSWQEIKSIHADIVGFYVPQHKKNIDSKIQSVGDVKEAWQQFRSLVRQGQGSHEAFMQLIDVIENKTDNQGNLKVQILDHGCNQGFTLFYLLALGCDEVCGIDLPETHCSQLNEFTTTVLGIDRKVFFEFDGGALPFKASGFDILISQQVLEHVEERFFKTYINEGLRVLKDDGVGFYELPVRTVLYDSHLQLWFLHMLPRFLWLFFVRLLRGKKRMLWAEETLFLRYKSTISGMFKLHSCSVTNITAIRLVSSTSSEHYVGSLAKKKLRILLTKCIQTPIVGRVLAHIISPWVIQTFIVRKY